MVDLSYEDLDKYIGEVCAGQKIIYPENAERKEVPVLLRHVTQRDRDLSTHIYRRALKEAEEEELPSLAQMEVMIEERHLFSEADRQALVKLESKLSGQKAILAKTTRVPANRVRLHTIISNIETEIMELRLRKERLYDFTRERKATEERMLYLTWRGARDPFTEELYWKTYEDFKNEKDFLFRKRVFVEFTIFYYGIDQAAIRCVARSGLWRIRFVNAMKTGESLFGRPMSEYTTDQLMVCYWSNFYQSIYEMMPDDRPPEQVIEDDAALDAYMKDWSAERSREATASQSKKNKYGMPSAWDFGEALVMKSNDNYEDVEYSQTLKEKGQAQGVTQNAAPTRGKKGR